MKPFYHWSHTRKMTFATLLAAFTAILQASGNYLPVVGLFLSMFATSTVFISVIVSVRSGFLSYIVTIFLLLILSPSEFFVFPFTTGLLGLTLGIGLKIGLPRILLVIVGGSMLVIGIYIVIYVFGFPVLGPLAISIQFTHLFYLLVIASLYSLLWFVISIKLLDLLQKLFH